MLTAISLGACGTLTRSTSDTFCLTYEPVRMTDRGWTWEQKNEPRAYRSNQRNNAKHMTCPK